LPNASAFGNVAQAPHGFSRKNARRAFALAKVPRGKFEIGTAATSPGKKPVNSVLALVCALAIC